MEAAHRGRVLIVTWQAGGGVPPAVGLGRLLAAHGHEVVVLGPRLYQARIERAGCAWRPIPAEAEFDPSAGRAAEEQRTYIRETFLGRAMPAGVTAEVEAGRPDVLVIDAMLLSTRLRRADAGPADRGPRPHHPQVSRRSRDLGRGGVSTRSTRCAPGSASHRSPPPETRCSWKCSAAAIESWS